MPRYRTRIRTSNGNLKVGKDTLIINITSATDCPSRRLRLCQVPEGACYALKSENEKFRPAVLPYRRDQKRIWDELSAEEIAQDFKVIASRKRKIPLKYVRFQESGDFRGYDDLQKMNRIADLLTGVLKCYTYTARSDLFGSPVRISPNLVINGSGFMVDNEFRVVNKENVTKGPRCRGIKGGGCMGCVLCKTKGGKVIQEVLRGSKKKVAKGGVHDTTDAVGDVIAEEGLQEVFEPLTATRNGASPRRPIPGQPRTIPPQVGGIR